MASDDDMAEMARLRAQRAPRGSARNTASYFEDEPQPAYKQKQTEESDGEAEHGPVMLDEAVDYAAGLRSTFPMAFGKQTASTPVMTGIYDKMRRKKDLAGEGTVDEELAVGPAPPPDPSADFVGPARPPADDDMVGPMPPPPSTVMDQTDEAEDDPYQLPVTHEAVLQGHTRMVTAIAVDPSGSRVITGGCDYTVRMYDFNGMKNDMRSFRNMEPHDGHPIVSLSFSPTGDSFLAVSGASQAKLYDRDGKTLGEFIRGDMYIRDMKNTKGHVSGLCMGQWHPRDKETVLTCSEDGTLRLWDAVNIEQKLVMKPTLRKPGRVAVTACCYSPDGGLIAGGLRDGSIQLWNARGKFGRSAAIGQVLPPKAQMIQQQTWKYVASSGQVVRNAHPTDTDITCLCFSKSGQQLLSRAMDDTLKVWDIRNLRAPVKEFDGLPNTNGQTQACFSPDEQCILTGVSEEEGKPGSGGLCIIDANTLEVVRHIEMPGGVIPVLWHDRINQILVGTGGRSNCATHVLYNPHFSERGALLSAVKAPRKKSPFDFQAPLIIHNPHALPMFREPRSKKRQRDKERDDPLKTRRPDPGLAVAGLGVGKGGKIGVTGGTLLTQHLMKTRGQMVSVDEEQDPRERILRHQSKKDEFSLYTAAYKKTQPNPIYAEPEEDQDDGEAGG